MSAESDPSFMLSLARGLAVLRAFERRDAVNVAQAAKAAGLPRSSAGRCLHTLARLGYLVEAEGSYRLTPAMLPLTAAYMTSDPLAAAAQPIVNAVRDRLGESSSVAVLDTRGAPDQVVYVCRAETVRIISAPLNIGSVLPSFCTAMGRVLLAALGKDALGAYLDRAPFPARTPHTIVERAALEAELDRVRAQGWCLVDRELELGLRSIAVPVRNRRGQTVAALNVGAQVRSLGVEALLGVALPELQAAAMHLGRVV